MSGLSGNEVAHVSLSSRATLCETAAKLNPKVIVSLGTTAFTWLTGVGGLVNKRSPRLGYVHHTRYGLVIPALHPLDLGDHGFELEAYSLLAIRRAREIALDGVEICSTPPHLHLNVWPDLPEQFEELMVDIETDRFAAEESGNSKAKIVRIGLAWKEEQNLVSASLPWSAETMVKVKALVSRANLVMFWNQIFDKPLLEREGFEFGPVRDAMLVWHFLQPQLPKALGAAAPFFWNGEPWKHRAEENPALYNALDAWMQLHIYYGCSEALGTRMKKYEEGPEKVMTLLDRASRVGILIDVQASENLKMGVDAEQKDRQKVLDSLVPESCLPLKKWKEKPANNPEAFEFEGGWAVRKSFLANSPAQVLHLAKSLDISLPDTNEKTLWKVQHPVFREIIAMRKLNSTLSTFMMKPAKDGAVHPSFSYFPSTFRKSCREPNLQSLPARHPLTKKIREQLVARPGYMFVAADSSAIEAVVVGWLANSERYMRLAKAGIHGWLTAKQMKAPFEWHDPEAALKAKLAKKAWPEVYEKCKRIIHLSNYGGTPARIFLEYPETFSSVKEAKVFQNFYLESEPGMDMLAWRQKELELAKRQGYVETPWGVRGYFTRALAFNWESKTWRPGEQAKDVYAYRPQSIASSIQDFYLLNLPQELQKTVRLVRHDEILMEVAEYEKDWALATLMEVMTMPIVELDGLVIGCEGKWGHTLNF
ncbi:MAG: DNA polymerase [bacterium]